MASPTVYKVRNSVKKPIFKPSYLSFQRLSVLWIVIDIVKSLEKICLQGSNSLNIISLLKEND